MAQTGRRRAGTRGRKKAEAATRPAAAGAAEKPVRGLAPGVENFFTGLPPEELGGPLTKEETGMALMAAGGRANAASGVMSLVISSLQVVRRLAAGARRGETGTPAVLYSLIESGSPAPCLETGRLLLEQPERADLVTAAVLAEHLTRFAGHGSWDSLELALRLAARLPVLAEAEEVRARLLGLLDIAVKKGLPQALREDGLILKEGLLTDRDTARARDLLEKTWAAGDAEAGLGLAGLLLEEAPSPEERRRALAILRGLADADSPGACALLGAELALGGREPGSADSADEGDFAEGVALLEKACALGRAREVTAVCQRLFALAMVRADRSCAKSGAKAAGTSSAKSASARSASAKGSARSVSKEPAGAAPRGKAGPGEQEAAERLLDRALAADCPEAEILRTRLELMRAAGGKGAAWTMVRFSELAENSPAVTGFLAEIYVLGLYGLPRRAVADGNLLRSAADAHDPRGTAVGLLAGMGLFSDSLAHDGALLAFGGEERLRRLAERGEPLAVLAMGLPRGLFKSLVTTSEGWGGLDDADEVHARHRADLRTLGDRSKIAGGRSTGLFMARAFQDGLARLDPAPAAVLLAIFKRQPRSGLGAQWWRECLSGFNQGLDLADRGGVTGMKTRLSAVVKDMRQAVAACHPAAAAGTGGRTDGPKS